MMKDGRIFRIGAIAATVAALGHVAATSLEPDWSGKTDDAIRIVAASGIWTADQLIDLISLLLTVVAFAVVGSGFAAWPGREWMRVGQPLLALMGALGAIAILTGATLKTAADGWVSAAPDDTKIHLATFATTADTTSAYFFGAFLALGLYLATVAAAILYGGPYPRWVGWTSAASALLLISGDLVMLVNAAGFLVVLVGMAIFTVVLVALGVTLWRHATLLGSTEPNQAPAPRVAA
jgi:hypothetical protein